MRKSKIILIVAVILLAAILVTVGGMVLSNIINSKNPISGDKRIIDAEGDLNSVTISGRTYQRRDDIESYLIIGLDTFGPQKSSDGYYNKDQADYLMLIAIDKAEKKVRFLMLNRDTICEVPQLGVGNIKYGTAQQQLALAHTYGDGMQSSCENTVDAVSALLFGTKIDYYASITMDGVSKLNDYIGGVEVDGNLLLGDDALSFVRARIGVDDSTNIARMERQNKYMTALVSKINSLQLSASYVDSALSIVEDYILTNANLLKVYDLLDGIKDYSFEEIKAPKGEANYSGEYVEFNVDREDLGKIIIDMFYKQK